MMQGQDDQSINWTVASLATDPSVTLFQKILLCTDGTVTELLSLYCGAPIEARKVDQSLHTRLGNSGSHAPPARILHRSVVLQGAGGIPFLYAESQFMFDLFSLEIQRDLIETDLPIGLLWRREQLEMHREVIERKREINHDVAILLGVDPQEHLLSRTYRIVHRAQEVGIITEKFAPSVLF